VSIRFKICSLYGTTEYNLTKKGLENIKYKGKISEKEIFNSYYQDNREDIKVNYFNEEKTSFERIRDLFEVKYIPN